MRILKEYIRTIVVSLEFLIVLITAALVYYRPAFIGTLRTNLNLTPDIMRYFAIAPATCLGLILNDARKVLFPAKDKKERLQSWEQYWKLRVTINVAILYAVFFLLVALFAWINTSAKYDDVTLLLIVGAILGSGVDYLSVYNAELMMNELFLKHSLANEP